MENKEDVKELKQEEEKQEEEKQEERKEEEKPKKIVQIKRAAKDLMNRIDKKTKIAILSVLSLIALIVLPSFVKLYALPALGFNEYRKGRKL